MDKTELKRLRGLVMIADADLKTSKAVMRADPLSTDKLICHLTYVKENCIEALDLLGAEQLTLDLEGEEKNGE